ncbi:MAG: hypothetical protein RL311_695 [Bacteroidota bacterium]
MEALNLGSFKAMKLTREIAESVLDHKTVANFDFFNSIEPAAAKILAINWSHIFPESPLKLNGIINLKPEEAIELSVFYSNNQLELNGLKSMDLKTADALVWSSPERRKRGLCKLNLDGLEYISLDVANIFSRFSCDLSLAGIKNLDRETAKALSRTDGLFLNGLNSLNKEVAEAFVERSNSVISEFSVHLAGLEKISIEVAEIFQEFGRYGHAPSFYLDGFSSIKPEILSLLLKSYAQTIGLNGLKTIESWMWKLFIEVTTEIVRNGHPKLREININGVTKIELPKDLNLEKGNSLNLQLNGLNELNLSEAQFLAQLQYFISLEKITQLSDECFKELAFGSTVVSLAGLETIDNFKAEILQKTKSKSITDLAPLYLSGEVIGIIDKSIDKISMHKLKTLDAETAKKLLEYETELYFGGLEVLEIDVAKVLSTCMGRLSLPGITKITPEIASILAQTQAYLSLGLTEISDEVAKKLAGHKGKDLWLGSFETISFKVASAFSKFKGKLALSVKHLDMDVANILSTGSTRKTNGEEIYVHYTGRLDLFSNGYLKNLADSINISGIFGHFSLFNKNYVDFCEEDCITPKAARKFIQSSKSFETCHDGLLCLESAHAITEEVAEIISEFLGTVNIPAIRVLKPQILKILVSGKVNCLGIGVDHFDDDFFDALKDYKGILQLLSLRSLKEKDAFKFAQLKCDIEFFGLENISNECAKILKLYRFGLSFFGLRDIELDAAKALCESDGKIFVSSPMFGEITENFVFLFAQCKTSQTNLNWVNGCTFLKDTKPFLTMLSAYLQEEHFRNEIEFWHLRNIEAECAKILTKVKKSYSFPKLLNLSVDVAKAFSKIQGSLALDFLQELTPEIAQQLAKHQVGILSLKGIKKLDNLTAIELCKRKKGIILDGLKELNEEIAWIFSTRTFVELSLNGLKSLSDKSAELLAEKGGVVRLKGLTKISKHAFRMLKSRNSFILSDNIRCY